jgi:hypothetical protein
MTVRKTWLLVGFLAAAGFTQESKPAARHRVLVELFTSQG